MQEIQGGSCRVARFLAENATIRIMQSATKDSLKSILDWLEGADKAGWERQIELGEQCRSDIERIARTQKVGAQGPERNLNVQKLNRAVPHVLAMITAMRNRNRASALEHGKAALAVM